MKLNKIIIFYPSFERGGVEKILINIIDHSIKSGLNICLISSKKKEDKHNLSQIILKKRGSRVISALFASISLFKELLKNYKFKNSICILSLQSNTLAIIVGKLLGYKVVIRNSEYPLGSLINNDSFILKTYLIFFQKILFYNFANLIISNSKGSCDTLKNFVISKKKVIYIYNPYLKKINFENFNHRENCFLFAGRFVKQKGINYLLKAFKEFEKINTNYKLFLVGSGPLEKYIKIFINLNKLEKKIFIINWTQQLDHYYKKAKFFVLPSIYEGLGNVVIESLNNSTPCIVSDCAHGPKEIIEYGNGGLLFKSKNVDDLLNKMIYAEKNYDECIKKTKTGRQSLKRFLIENQVSKYLNEMNNLL